MFLLLCIVIYQQSYTYPERPDDELPVSNYAIFFSLFSLCISKVVRIPLCISFPDDLPEILQSVMD